MPEAYAEPTEKKEEDAKPLYKILDQKDATAKAKMYLTQSKRGRVQWEAWVATVENFFNGDHGKWFTNEGALVEKTLQPGEIWRVINLFPGAEDIRQNRLTKNDPQWYVKQSPGIVASPEDIDVANAYLQAVYRDNNWKDIVKKIIAFGDKRGTAPVVVGWDTKEDRPTLNYYDAWDFYPDPTSPGPDGWNWLLCSVPKAIDEVKEDGDLLEGVEDALKADPRYAQSGLKDRMERSRRGGRAAEGQIIFTQFFMKTQGVIIQYDIIGDMLIHEPKILPYASFDEFIDNYKPRDTERFYERPAASDWIDPQKTVNKVYSSIEGYIDMALNGRWRRIDKSITIPISGAHGQVIDAAIGDIEQFPMIPLPQTHFQMLDQAMQSFERIAGVHDESMGRVSGSVESGVGIAALQAADEQNSAMAHERLKTFMARVGVKVLRVASKNLKVATPIFVEQEPGMTVRMEVIGEEARTLRDIKQKKIYGIKPFSVIDVEIVPGTVWSDFQQQETVLNLIKSGYTPGQNPIMDRIVTTFWRMGNQRELTKMLEEFRDPDRMIAAGENLKMRNGAFIQPNASDKHQIHMEIHMMEAKKLQAIGDMQAQKNVLDHIEEHRMIMDQGRSQSRIPEAPVME